MPGNGPCRAGQARPGHISMAPPVEACDIAAPGLEAGFPHPFWGAW